MIEDKKVLALIPARGGSKGIKKKNIVDIAGKPLIAYSILAARESKYIDEVIITTDSEEIAEVAIKYEAKVPFIRPAELATDYSTTLDAVLHALKMLGQDKFDILVLLQPTSPLRTSNDIDQAIETFVLSGYIPLASVSEVNDSPILMRKVKEDGKMEKLLSIGSTIRRQDMPIIYRINGSIYINLINEIDVKTSFNDNQMAFIMEKSHSVDIDDYSDIAIVKYFMCVE